MNGRDPRFDLFRGLALAAILVTHTRYGDGSAAGVLHLWFFDFADVFVFISGCVCGLAYFKVLTAGGLAAAQAKASRRALTLAATNVLLTLACMIMLGALYAGDDDAEKIARRFRAWPYDWSLGGARHWFWPPTAAYVLDVLWMYAAMLLTMPAVAWLYLRSRASAVLLVSALYAYEQVAQTLGLPSAWLAAGDFRVLAWQALFFVALFLALEHRRGTLRLPRRPAAVAAAVLGVAAIQFLRIADAPIDVLTHKWSMRPLRIAELLLVAYLIARFLPATTALWHAPILRPLRMLGRHGLTAFSLGVLQTWLVSLLMMRYHLPAPCHWAMTAAGLLLTWAIVEHLERRASRPAHERPSASGPASTALAGAV